MVLQMKETITHWDEALALGNGDLGCLIWNKAECLRFSLDKGGIWDCSNPPENQEAFTYQNIKHLVKRKKYRKLKKKYDDCYNRPTPTKLPAGKIILDLGVNDNVVSALNLNTAEAQLCAGDVKVHAFINASETYGLIEINKTGISMAIENPKYGGPQKTGRPHKSRGTVQSLQNLHYPAAEFFNETAGDVDFCYFIQPTHDRFYGIVTAKMERQGKTLIAFTVGVGPARDFVSGCKRIVSQAVSAGYEAGFEPHRHWWAQYWAQSGLTLPDKMLEKQWYLNNYLLACCSRKHCFPMPLQGVWTADNGSLPPWKGDYHHDLNTQMSYTSYLKANHLEQGECFIDYLLDMAPAGRRFAKTFYGASGICLPAVMDIEGHALGGWCQYALSPVNQLWLCHVMARYYSYTKNESYFERIYAYMKETGVFLMDILEEKDGVYKLPLSTSPEMHDNSRKAWMQPNTNYDLALMRAFAEDMICFARLAGENGEAALWKRRLEKLEPLAVNAQHVLMLSPAESLRGSHRHHSHCMSIYPLRTLRYTTEENRRVIDSTIRDLEAKGISEWVGYSVGWMAQLYSIQRDGNKACEQLHHFFKYNCTANGFHINGDYQSKTAFHMKYRLFTLEGNFLAADAIQEMLLYSEGEELCFFPAIPEDWKNVSFKKFRAYGGLLVSAQKEGGKLTYIKIEASSDCTFHIENDISHLARGAGLPKTNVFTLKAGQQLELS